MILPVIVFAWLAIIGCEQYVDGAAYYLACSMSYSAISVLSIVVWRFNRSATVFAYAGVNFLAALFNWLISYPVGYDMLAAFHFGPFQVVAAVIEILALTTGGIDAIRYVVSRDPGGNSGGPLHHI